MLVTFQGMANARAKCSFESITLSDGAIGIFALS
jgi:hypothetical protein